MTVVCPAVSNLDSVDMLNAKAGGHFAAQGLDVTVVGSGSGVGALQQLVAGRCHFLRAAAVELIKAVARQSVALLAIGNPEHAVTYVMVSSPERPVRDPAMLRGRRVGVFAIGSTTDTYVDLMLHRAGVPPDEVTREAIGANPATFALVQMGRLDAIILPYEVASAILPESVVLPVSAFVTMPGRCYLTTRSLSEQDPALTLAFMRAMAASVQEIIAGPVEPIIARCAAAFDIPPSLVPGHDAALVRSISSAWLAGGRAALLRNVDAGWQAGVAAMAGAGIATVPSAAALYTNRFVEQALPL